MLRRVFCKAALIAVTVGALLTISSVLLAQGRSDDGLARAIEVQERHTDRLMALEGVVGTAVGLNPGGQVAVDVLLERPGVGGIPQQLEGVPVHPVVTGEIYALKPPTGGGTPVDRTDRFARPVPIGVSTGHPAITAGTIGCRVKRGNEVFALSNNHVYANQNLAALGDPVIQPGTVDGGFALNDTIGTLADFEPIVFYDYYNPPAPIPTNTMDAAIALSSPGNLGKATPSDGYSTPKSATTTASINQKVKKYGRTTGLTNGRITGLNATVNVGYGGGAVARFVGQIIIAPGNFSAGGDSGSLIVTQTGNNPVGLLFAGSSSITIANPIGAVLTRFGVTVDGQ